MHNTLALGVQSTGGLIEEQNTGVRDDGTSNGDTLLLSTGQEETTFTDHGVIAERELGNEAVGVGLDTRLLDQSHLLVLGGMLPLRADKTMRDIAFDGGCEESRLLRDETDLRTQPLDVQLAEVDAVKTNSALERVVEALDEGNDCRLSGARCTDKSDRLSGGERDGKILDDGNVGTRRVVELHVLQGNLANALLGLETGIGL